MRVAFVPRSAEIQPLFWRFVFLLKFKSSSRRSTWVNVSKISHKNVFFRHGFANVADSNSSKYAFVNAKLLSQRMFFANVADAKFAVCDKSLCSRTETTNATVA